MTVAIKLQRPKLIAIIGSALWLGAACAYVWGFTGTAGLVAVTLPEAAFLALVGVMPPLLLLAFLYDETARARLISIAQACLRIQERILPTQPEDTSIADWHHPGDVPPHPLMGGITKRGLIAALILFGGFGGWAALAPIESAAVATGQIRVESHHRTVAHLEGGIVKDILVHDGDHVAAGQVLMHLSSIDSNATRRSLREQQAILSAQQARLVAERDGAQHIVFPVSLLTRQQSDRAAADAIATQQKAFEARRGELQGAVGQYEAEIVGHHAQIAALDDQIKLFTNEIRDVSALLDKGLATRPRLSALNRDIAASQGQRGSEIAAVARAQQAIGDLKHKRASEIQADLSDTQDKLGQVDARLQTASDVDDRKEVVAPDAGRIVGMKVFTPGGVIQPGAPILDIVPDADFRIVEARIQPRDISVVHSGLLAQVVLTAYKRRITPVLNATVTNVSSDSLITTDTMNRTEYYSAEVSIDPKDLARSTEHLVLYPGMPVEVMIVTGKRTMLEYLLQPIVDSFRRSFRQE
jgi:HlyD family type I secretion membrane fusion protein